MTHAVDIALQLLNIKAIKLSPNAPFTWASGKQSPIYCDNRKALSYAATRSLIRDAFVAGAADLQPFQVVAGVATAGIPWGALVADALNLPFVYVRDKAKNHGMQNRIEGDLRGNERVLVIEDLISTGGSSLEAVETLRNVGCNIAGVMAIFTYNFAEATRRFADADCALYTLTNYDVLIDTAEKIGYVQATDLELLAAWRNNF
jgi:orotate phosphoribosyltransferase